MRRTAGYLTEVAPQSVRRRQLEVLGATVHVRADESLKHVLRKVRRASIWSRLGRGLSCATRTRIRGRGLSRLDRSASPISSATPLVSASPNSRAAWISLSEIDESVAMRWWPRISAWPAATGMRLASRSSQPAASTAGRRIREFSLPGRLTPTMGRSTAMLQSRTLAQPAVAARCAEPRRFLLVVLPCGSFDAISRCFERRTNAPPSTGTAPGDQQRRPSLRWLGDHIKGRWARGR